MKTQKMSISLPQKLVEEIERISEENNTTKSFVIKKALNDMLSNKLENDLKDLSKMKFDDLPSEEDWLIIQNECNKYDC